MPDKVECTLYPNDDGSPKLYDFSYTFDDGYGNFTRRSINIYAGNMADSSDAVEARASADVIAKAMKEEWLTSAVVKPQPVKIDSVSEDFDLGAVDSRTKEQKAVLDLVKAEKEAAEAAKLDNLVVEAEVL